MDKKEDKTSKIRLLTDWGKLNGLLKEPLSQEESEPLDLKELEHKLMTRFSHESDELTLFFKNLRKQSTLLNARAIHLQLSLKNSYFQHEFLRTIQDDLKSKAHEFYRIHCEKLRLAESPIAALKEIDSTVSVVEIPLKVVLITGCEKLSGSQWSEIKDYFSNTGEHPRHLFFYMFTGPTLIESDAFFQVSLKLKDFTEETMAESIVQNISDLAKEYKLGITYIEPEVVLNIYREIKKYQKGSNVPVYDMVNHFCLEAFSQAQQNNIKEVRLSMSWLGSVIIEKAAA